MQVIRRPRPAGTAVLPGCVATIGVFDGLHLGHRRILARVLAEARRLGLPSLVFSFEPTPQEVLSPAPPARLMRFREKVAALAAEGIDYLFCPPFDAGMRTLKPAEFIDRLLVRTLAVRHLVVGDDFRFAHRREGDVSHLRDAGLRHGFGVEQVGSVIDDGVRVSSTAIRTALAAGDLRAACRWLGRPYSLCGRVVRGRRLGRSLGYPTANIRLGRRVSPLAGIFAVRVRLDTETRLDGVASLGTRPTVDADAVEPLLEVHVFDFDGDLYGRYIEVEFIDKLREERRFPDLDALCRQMELDAAEARRRLAGEHRCRPPAGPPPGRPPFKDRT